MTRPHRIAAQIAAAHHIDPAQAEALVDLVFDAIAQAVLGGDQITLPGLGSFRTTIVAERRDYHPSTGMPITTPASRHLTFEPSMAPTAGAPAQVYKEGSRHEFIEKAAAK